MPIPSTRREAVQYDQFEAFADEYVAEYGREPSIRAAVAALGGSNTTVSDHKRAWVTRRERLGATTAVDENLSQDAVAGVYDAILVGLQPLWDEKLEQLKVKAEQDSETLIAQHEVYLQEVEAAERANQEATQQLALVHKDVGFLTLRLEDVETEKYEVAKALSELQTQHASVCSQMNAAVHALEEKFNTATQENTQLTHQLGDLSAQLQKSKDTISLGKHAMASLEDDITKLDTTHGEHIKHLTAQHEHERQQLRSVSEEHRHTAKQLQKTVATLTDQNKTQHGDIERVNSKLTATESQLLEARKTIEQQASKLAALQSDKSSEVSESIARLLSLEKRLVANLSKSKSG